MSKDPSIAIMPKTPRTLRVQKLAKPFYDQHPDRFQDWDINSRTFPALVWLLRAESKRQDFLAESLMLQVARQVRWLRIARQWTQEELATRAGISIAQVSMLERGDTRSWPGTATLLRLAAAFECGLAIQFVPVQNMIEERFRDQQRTPKDWAVPRYVEQMEDIEDIYGVEVPLPNSKETQNMGLMAEVKDTERQWAEWKKKVDEYKKQGMAWTPGMAFPRHNPNDVPGFLPEPPKPENAKRADEEEEVEEVKVNENDGAGAPGTSGSRGGSRR